MKKLSIESLSFAYNGRSVLKELDLQIATGELLALVGPNGSGKTTLLRQISGVLRPSQGAVYLDMKEVAQLKPSELARHLAALEQEHSVGFDFTVHELVGWGRLPHRRRFSRWSSSDEAAVAHAFAVTGIERLADRPVSQLSGGERQLAFLAMTLAQEPKVLLLDEPTVHLDLNHQVEIMELIRTQARQNLTVIAALHDLNLAAGYADRIAVLCRGRIVAVGSTQEVLTEELIRSVWGVRVRVLQEQENLWIVPHAQPPLSTLETSAPLDKPAEG